MQHTAMYLTNHNDCLEAFPSGRSAFPTHLEDRRPFRKKACCLPEDTVWKIVVDDLDRMITAGKAVAFA